MSRRWALAAFLGALGACGSLRGAGMADGGTEDTVEPDGGTDPSRPPRDGGKPPTKEAGRPADGSSVSTKGPVEIIASGFTRPQELALTADTVFFTLRMDAASIVRKVAKDGQNENEVVAEYDAKSGNNPLGESVLIVGEEVVWLDSNAGISAAPINGGTTRRIRGPLEKGRGLAHYNGVLYFSDSAFSPFGYALQRVLLDGGQLGLVDDYEITVGGIAADGTGVYWTAAGALANGKAAARTQPIGADAAATRDLFTDIESADMGGIALSDSEAFWAETERGRISRAPKAGGPSSVLAKDLNSPRRVALDDTYVWFTTATTVSRVPRAGGEVEEFVTEIASPIGIAVDATHVYWAASGTGEIGRIHK